MNRQTLAEATSLHDGPVPVYLLEEIAGATKTSARDATKTADYVLGRLQRSNLNVKLKALQIILFCLKEGSHVFAEVIREDEHEISTYLQFSGASDPVYGDEKSRRIRAASQDVLVCLKEGALSRQNEALEPQPQQPQPLPGDGLSSEQERGDSALMYSNANGGYSQSGQPERQHSSVGGSWGQPRVSCQPAFYRDSSSGGFSRPSEARSFVFSNGGASSYGASSCGQNGGSSGGHGYSQNGAQSGFGQNALPQQQHLQQASGFNSWVSSSGSGVTSKSSGAGTWSSSGYQKKDAVVDNELRYNLSTGRDNRPTVLVGHSLHFPKPAGGFGSSNTGATSALGGFSSGTYDPNAIRGAIGASVYNPNSMGNSAQSGGFSSHQSGGTATYTGNSNRMSGNAHRIGSIGLPVNGQPLNDIPTTTLGKKAEVLKKMGTAALEKWDRRNMDKSMASSLADHDELRAGPQVIDHNYYQPNAQQGAGGGDTSRDYERTMIDNLCAPAGLSRAPPADGLKRFVDLAQTLDAQTIGDILLDKLEDETWQVRLKGLHVVLALLDSPGAGPYQEFFEENVEVVEELQHDAKPSVVSKALQILHALGYADEVASQPSRRRVVAKRYQRSSSTKNRVQQPQQEVDLLGFDSLSLELSAGSLDHSVQGTSDLFDSPIGVQPPTLPTPFQEVSFLDGFDTLGSSSSYNPSYTQQRQAVPSRQQYYQQPEQDERNKSLSHFEKDLFAIANSPRTTAGTLPHPGTSDGPSLSGSQSAFNFL